jgi:hypothetical protein
MPILEIVFKFQVPLNTLCESISSNYDLHRFTWPLRLLTLHKCSFMFWPLKIADPEVYCIYLWFKFSAKDQVDNLRSNEMVYSPNFHLRVDLVTLILPVPLSFQALR